MSDINAPNRASVGGQAEPTPEEVADLLRLVEFAMSHGRTSMVAFVDRRHTNAIERDFDRMGEVLKQVNAMLDRLPPEPPMSPETEAKVGAFLGAVLDKRFGGGSQQAVDDALAAWVDPPPAARRSEDR